MKPYELVIEESIANLKRGTNDAISKGYIPQGGITFVDGYYIQPIYNPNIK